MADGYAAYDYGDGYGTAKGDDDGGDWQDYGARPGTAATAATGVTWGEAQASDTELSHPVGRRPVRRRAVSGERRARRARGG